jgi:hypothetical protein
MKKYVLLIILVSLVLLSGCSHNALIAGSEANTKCPFICEKYNLTYSQENSLLTENAITCYCEKKIVIERRYE